MLIDNIELQNPPRRSTQTALESVLHKQHAKQPAAKRHKQDKHEPAAAKAAHSVRKRTNSTSKACTEQHKCSDIRRCWCNKPKEEQPKAAAALTANNEQQAKKARTEGDTSLKLPSLRTLCWNVLGLTNVQDELVRIVDEHKPDVIVLTKTKMRRQGKTRQKLAGALPEYQLYTSCKPDAESAVRQPQAWRALGSRGSNGGAQEHH